MIYLTAGRWSLEVFEIEIVRSFVFFSYQDLNFVNVVLNLPGVFLLVVFVLLQSDQTSQVSSKFWEKKSQKRNFWPQTKTLSMASFCSTPSLLLHHSLSHD